MTWHDQLATELVQCVPGGYSPAGPAASEPTALAAIALTTAGKYDAAARGCDWLCELQGRDGSIGVMAAEPTPSWPTSLAMLAWHGFDRASHKTTYKDATARATQWALDSRGLTAPRKEHIGHDTSLIGWPWVAGTHSWLEPTAFFALALKAVGQSDHPRTREAIRLIVDRLLPAGGCNYGNSMVLGQWLLPHVQPTGIALWALSDEAVSDDRIARSLDYLEQQLSAATATASLCYGLLGLAAHGRRPAGTDEWLQTAHYREQQRGPTCYKLALLALAATPSVARPITAQS